MTRARRIAPWGALALAGALALVGSTACQTEADGAAGPRDCESVAQAPPESLRWRRYDLLLGSLGRALSLSRDELCVELGTIPCAELHQVALGGNNPFEQTMYEPVSAPLPLTPLVIDRVVLSACTNRVAADRVGEPVVFTAIDLTAESVESEDSAVRSQIRELFRRLHGREPTDPEIEVVAGLADGSTGQDFATLACFAIASTTEMVLL